MTVSCITVYTMRNDKEFKEMTTYRKKDMIEVTCKMETGIAGEQTEKSRPPRQAGND